MVKLSQEKFQVGKEGKLPGGGRIKVCGSLGHLGPLKNLDGTKRWKTV